MLCLPKTTEFNKRIPKQKFYDNINVSPPLKRVFVDQVKVIYWKNKIATTTTNLAAGKYVTELEVFEIKLNSPLQDDSLLRQIDKSIPYHILFLLEYQDKYQAWIGYKEATQSGINAFKVNNYYHTDWLKEDELSLKLDGLNLDAVYENYVCQIAGDNLQSNNNLSLQDNIEIEEKRKAIQKQIETLQTKIRKEKQFNKQMWLNAELKKLKEELNIMVKEGLSGKQQKN